MRRFNRAVFSAERSATVNESNHRNPLRRVAAAVAAVAAVVVVVAVAVAAVTAAPGAETSLRGNAASDPASSLSLLAVDRVMDSVVEDEENCDRLLVDDEMS